MPAQLSARILILAFIVVLYCSSLLLFSGRSISSTANTASDEALKVVALAEEKDHEVVIDVNIKPTPVGQPSYEWDGYIAPYGVDSHNQGVGPQLDTDNENEPNAEDTLTPSSDEEQDIPSAKLPENNSDLNVSKEDSTAAPAETDEKEEATEEDEEVIEFGDSSIDGESEDKGKEGDNYANDPSVEEALQNPDDFLPLEFDNNLWEANPRQLSLETAAAYPANKKKPSPYIKDYKDLSGKTHNSSHVVCKGNKCEERANAVIVVLCRNSELVPMRRTLREFEEYAAFYDCFGNHKKRCDLTNLSHHHYLSVALIGNTNILMSFSTTSHSTTISRRL